MKVLLINGSARKRGATGRLLEELKSQLESHENVDAELIHVSDLHLECCTGCGRCFREGACFLKDDGEMVSDAIVSADAVVLGSPTYLSNLSGKMKVLLERGHFVVEQLLHGKYALSVITYENYGGKDAQKIMHRLLSYSGASIVDSVLVKVDFEKDPLLEKGVQSQLTKAAEKLYHATSTRKKYRF